MMDRMEMEVPAHDIVPGDELWCRAGYGPNNEMLTAWRKVAKVEVGKTSVGVEFADDIPGPHWRAPKQRSRVRRRR